MPRQDPRLDGQQSASANEQIRDRTIRHLLFLTRVSTREANEITAFIEQNVTPDLEDQLRRRLASINERGFDTGPATTRRLQDLIDAMNRIAAGGLAGARERLQQDMVELAQDEAAWQVGVIQQSVPVSLEMTIPAAEQLRQAVIERPFDGMPLSRWFDGLTRQTQQNLERAVRQGVVEGETVDAIVRRVRGTRARGFEDGVMRTTTRNARAITRTAVQHVNTQARLRTLEENSDVVKGVQWIATLDTRTCPECQGLDGKVDDGSGGAVRGHPNLRGRRPPAHVSCRCSAAPVLKSWRELGIDLDEAPEGTRASMDGQVPESLTYNDWLRRRVNDGDMEVVEEALGKTRAKVFAAGGADVGDFTDARGRTLTLRELRERERERDAFEAAGVEI